MPEEEEIDFEWEFCQEFFQELTVNVKELYTYEASIKKLERQLWQDLKQMDDIKLSGPLLKVKTKREWEQWELDNTDVMRVGYRVSKEQLRTREMLEGQVKWRLEWMRRNAGTMDVYRDSPRELCIDPTYCPCERRYSSEEFARIQTKFPLALNYS